MGPRGGHPHLTAAKIAVTFTFLYDPPNKMPNLHYVFIALEVLLIFNLIIGVHELGHFLAAKWRGLKIDRFAIWFGKPIW